MKKKLTFISLALLVSIILFFELVPVWIQAATRDELKNWYPTFGTIAFYFIRIFLPIAFAVSIGALLFLWTKDVLSYIKYGVEFLRDKISNNRRGFFYAVFLMILVAQFYYNYNYDEVYPAVMMPLFGQGIYPNPIEVETDELIVKNCNEQLYTLQFYELLTEVIGDEEGKMISAKKITQVTLTDNLKLWLNIHARKRLKENCIKEIEIIKITSEYFYNGQQFSLKNEKKEQLHKITY